MHKNMASVPSKTHTHTKHLGTILLPYVKIMLKGTSICMFAYAEPIFSWKWRTQSR